MNPFSSGRPGTRSPLPLWACSQKWKIRNWSVIIQHSGRTVSIRGCLTTAAFKQLGRAVSLTEAWTMLPAPVCSARPPVAALSSQNGQGMLTQVKSFTTECPSSGNTDRHEFHSNWTSGCQKVQQPSPHLNKASRAELESGQVSRLFGVCFERPAQWRASFLSDYGQGHHHSTAQQLKSLGSPNPFILARTMEGIDSKSLNLVQPQLPGFCIINYLYRCSRRN